MVSLAVWNPRDYTHDKHRTVDDRPYGGGPGMVMKFQPLLDAVNAARQKSVKPWKDYMPRAAGQTHFSAGIAGSKLLPRD